MASFYAATKVMAENQDGEILMVQESKDFINGKWDFPGGGLENGESVIEAAKREFREETGRSVEVGDLVGIYNGASNSTGTETIVFVFEGEIGDKIDRELEDDVMDTGFFQPEEVRQLELREPNRRKILENYLQGERYPKELLWNNLELLE